MFILVNKFLLICILINVNITIVNGVMCLNCSSTHRSWTRCGDTVDNALDSTKTMYKDVVNCTEENALCFIRSWRARAKHAWIVQRGCYELTAQDTLPVSLSEARKMSCKRQRLPDAEYKLCFCQGDQCNRSYELRYDHAQLFVLLIITLFLNFDV